MWRIWRNLSMLLMVTTGWTEVLQAQDPAVRVGESFEKSLRAPNSVAQFQVSLSPASASVGDEVTLSLRVRVDEDWHIGATTELENSFGFPTQIGFVSSGLEPIDSDFVCSASPRKVQLAAGTQLWMDGEFSWVRKFRVVSEDASYGGQGHIRFQACNDEKCLPPQELQFELGAAPVASDGDTKSPDAPMHGIDDGQLEKPEGAPIVLSLEACELTRTRPQLGNIVSLLIFGRSADKMVWKGAIPSGSNQGVSIYLPKAREYSLQNTGPDGTIVNNTATYVSVDQNGDGVLAEWEASAADRPIRIRDTMYRITEIDVNNRTLTLQQLNMPLRGSLVGFRCPDFEFTTLDGATITNKSILGKVTVLDVWAVSCHNCYEGFPALQRALDKHSSEKLQVVLLTVDEIREYYDSQAPKLFATYGGGNWPQVMVPGGFNGVTVIGDYGFGSVIVDQTGIVRAVGAHGHNMETLLDELFK